MAELDVGGEGGGGLTWRKKTSAMLKKWPANTTPTKDPIMRSPLRARTASFCHLSPLSTRSVGGGAAAPGPPPPPPGDAPAASAAPPRSPAAAGEPPRRCRAPIPPAPPPPPPPPPLGGLRRGAF